MISPVLANLFLHYVFDDSMVKEFPAIPWARYADDGIAHCVSQKQAKYLRRRLGQRFQSYRLELNQEKTRIVYCKDDDRRGNHENTFFDFLGYIFHPRHAKNRYGKFFIKFLPAISEKAKKAIRKEVRGWKLQLKSDKDLYDIMRNVRKVPEDVLHSKEFKDYLLPVVKNDFLLLHNFTDEWHLTLPPCPIFCVYGEQDYGIEEKSIYNWNNYAQSPVFIIF